MHLDIAGIDIRSSAIAWRDESSGETASRRASPEFKNGRIASGVPGKLSLSARVEAMQPKPTTKCAVWRLPPQFRKADVRVLRDRLKIPTRAGLQGASAFAEGDVEFDASPQAIRFTLAADQVNLDRYLPPPPPKRRPARRRARARPRRKPEEPIDLSALKGLNLKGDLKIERLIASNVKLERVHLGVKAAGGQGRCRAADGRSVSGQALRRCER